MPNTRRTGSILVVIAAMFLAVLSAPSVSAQTGWRAPDRLTASGYDFYSERVADVVAGSDGNNIVFWYRAGSSLTDGVVEIGLPRANWPDPLKVGEPLSGASSENGSVVVRPNAEVPATDGGRYCTDNPVAPMVVSISQNQKSTTIKVERVNCKAGERLAIRIFGIKAPPAAGRYGYTIRASDASGDNRVIAPKLAVVPTPNIRLTVSAPAVIVANAPVIIAVSAVKTNGRPANSYRGAVALVSQDQNDCTMDYQYFPFDIGVRDRGTIYIQTGFQQVTSHRVMAYAVDHSAVSGVSSAFEIAWGPEGPLPVTCPVSFH